jgi:hypothetical protein
LVAGVTEMLVVNSTQPLLTVLLSHSNTAINNATDLRCGFHVFGVPNDRCVLCAGATKILVVNSTQPLLSTGQLRWALDNVASTLTPSCTSFLDDVYQNGQVTNNIPLNAQATLKDPATLENEAVSKEEGSATTVCHGA